MSPLVLELFVRYIGWHPKILSMSLTSHSTPSSVDTYKKFANDIVHKNEKVRKELTRLLKHKFMAKGYSAEQWDIASFDYLQYRVAHEIGLALGMQTAPPLHVDTVWQMHLLEETESYHRLEQKIIKGIKKAQSVGLVWQKLLYPESLCQLRGTI